MPWTYEAEPSREATGDDAEWLSEVVSLDSGAVLAPRQHLRVVLPLARSEPVGVPFFIVTHLPEEQPDSGAFTFVSGVEEAVEQARAAACDKDVHVMSGADIILQVLQAGIVDELTIIVAPVVLGGGKRLFEGFTTSLDLEHLGVRQSPYATFVDYGVKGVVDA